MADQGLNFYQILRIDPKVEQREIIVAIKKMRKFDKHGSYTATINRIEEILTDPKKRAVYDRENGFVESPALEDDVGFLDIDLDTFESHHSQQQDIKHDVRQELSRNSLLGGQNQRPPRMAGLNLGQIITFFSVLLIALAALVFSKPILDKYNGNKQVASAVSAIHQAEEQVENYIRKNAVFPDKFSFSPDSNYQLNLDSENTRIILRFQGKSIDELQGAELISTFVTKPNITEWHCAPGKYFPSNLTPVNCY